MGLPPFQAFLDGYREDVYRFLVAAVGPQEAEDCFQETFLSALRAYPRLQPDSNLRSWIFTIAHRKALDTHRARSRAPSPLEDAPESSVAAAVVAAAAVPDESLWRAVWELPTKQRAAVLHRYVSDLVYRDIARILGCSEEAARRNVHEGLKSLRKAWHG